MKIAMERHPAAKGTVRHPGAAGAGLSVIAGLLVAAVVLGGPAPELLAILAVIAEAAAIWWFAAWLAGRRTP